MKALRRAGKSYVEIGRAVGVAKSTAIHYLRDLRVEDGAMVEEWKKAEREAVGFLRRNGFSEVHDLNAISPSPYWDLLAKRESDWWLVDVTVSATKQIGGKIPSTVEGYTHAILYKNMHTSEWKLVRIILEEIT
ncbi:MAG: hypothetical protein ACE5EW_06860 [Thermoplasmata archaeon]